MITGRHIRSRIGALARRAIRAAGERSTRSGARRRSARRALGSGALAFVLVTAALAVAAETVKPEWRDPEYGHRLKQARGWKKKRPDRPLVLVIGSSRTQYGVSPADMGFADEPRQPLVYNFGYRGAHPVGAYLQLTRALDHGLAPRAVVVHLSAVELRCDGPAEALFPNWGPRLSSADLRRLEPFATDPAVFRGAVGAARRDPWAARRTALLSDRLAEWQTLDTRHAHRSWESMSYGFSPLYPEDVTDEFRAGTRKQLPSVLVSLNDRPIGAASDRAIRAMVARCRAENIPVAACWTPESPSFRALYTPAGRDARDRYERALTSELGIPVFSAPEHLDDDDFADGYHLLRDGAAKYSRWLADRHLRPWLAEMLK